MRLSVFTLFGLLVFTELRAAECRAITNCSSGRCVAETVCGNAPQIDPRLSQQAETLDAERRRLAEERRRFEAERLERKRAAESNNLRLKTQATLPDDSGTVSIIIESTTEISSLRINGFEEGGRPAGVSYFRRVPPVGTKTSYRIDVVDSFGNTATEIVAVDRTVVAATRSTPLNPARISARQSSDSVVLIIGVSKYKRLPGAEYSDLDARVFYDYARRAIGAKPENIKLLIDEEADKTGIRRALEAWLPSVAKKGTPHIYVFYSGHGLPSKDGESLYLMPWDADRDYLEDTAISQAGLLQALGKTNPSQITLFLDSCYSGQSRSGETLLVNARPVSVRAKAASVPKNTTMLSAASADELSLSSSTLKHGVFSYYLMRGMEGEADVNGDGIIQTDELFAFVKQSVERESAALGRKQTPVLYGSGNQVVGRIK